MKLTWKTLLCAETLAEKEKIPSSWTNYPLDPVEQDYREIISSVDFRRLQDKTQVYQDQQAHFVRTRLTHSLEVSTLAKQLGIMMIYNEKWNHIPPFADLTVDQARAIPTILACAGLLHDMGNPPFGHEGEKTIGYWFESHLKDPGFTFRGRPAGETLTEQMRRDLCYFEGNAQVIRMLSRSRNPYEERKANVTFATISSLIKYPANSLEADKRSSDTRIHKTGYFLSEQDFVKEIRAKTGMDLPEEPHARNPLTYLLEAADDIAYLAADLEDAVVVGDISFRQMYRFIMDKLETLPENDDEMEQMQRLTAEGILHNLEQRMSVAQTPAEEAAVIHQWTNYLRNWFMYVTAGSFVRNWEAIMDGGFRGDLLSESHHKYTVQFLRDEMADAVYPGLCRSQLAANTILTELLDLLVPAVRNWDSGEKLAPAEEKCISMIPRRLKQAYQFEKTGDAAYDLYLRFRMATDYLASMTDSYALELYKEIKAF